MIPNFTKLLGIIIKNFDINILKINLKIKLYCNLKLLDWFIDGVVKHAEVNNKENITCHYSSNDYFERDRILFILLLLLFLLPVIHIPFQLPPVLPAPWSTDD